MYTILTVNLLLGILLSCTSPVSSKIPNLAEIKVLLQVYFPNLNENTTILSFLSDERNVQLLDKVHLHSCMDLKRKRKVRSLDWLWNEFTMPIDQIVKNGSTFTPPQMCTLNDTEEERYSYEGKFYNPYISNDTSPNLGPNETTSVYIGKTPWPTNAYGDKIPKNNMKAMDYINLINNDMSREKNAAGAGGCPLGFGGDN